MSIYGILLIALVMGVIWFASRLLLEHDVGAAFGKGALVFVLAAVILFLGNLLAPQLFADANGIVQTGWQVAKNGPEGLNPVIDLKGSFSQSPQPPAVASGAGGVQVQNVVPVPTPEPPKPPEKGDAKWDSSPALALAECYGSPQGLLLTSLQKGGFPLGVQWKLSSDSRWAVVLPESLEGDWTMSISLLGVGRWQLSLDPSMAHSIKDQWGSSGVGQLPWPKVPMIYDGTKWVPNGDCQWP